MSEGHSIEQIVNFYSTAIAHAEAAPHDINAVISDLNEVIVSLNLIRPGSPLAGQADMVHTLAIELRKQVVQLGTQIQAAKQDLIRISRGGGLV